MLLQLQYHSRLLFREEMAADIRDPVKDAICYYGEQQKQLEENLGRLFEYGFVRTLLEAVSSMEQLSTIIL